MRKCLIISLLLWMFFLNSECMMMVVVLEFFRCSIELRWWLSGDEEGINGFFSDRLRQVVDKLGIGCFFVFGGFFGFGFDQCFWQGQFGKFDIFLMVQVGVFFGLYYEVFGCFGMLMFEYGEVCFVVGEIVEWNVWCCVID